MAFGSRITQPLPFIGQAHPSLTEASDGLTSVFCVLFINSDVFFNYKISLNIWALLLSIVPVMTMAKVFKGNRFTELYYKYVCNNIRNCYHILSINLWSRWPHSLWRLDTMTRLTATEYLCHKWPRICSFCLNHSPVLPHSWFITELVTRVTHDGCDMCGRKYLSFQSISDV